MPNILNKFIYGTAEEYHEFPPTTFTHSEKTVNEHGVRFWFNPRKLNHQWSENSRNVPEAGEFEDIAKKFFPLSMFLDSELCVDFEIWYDEVFSRPPSVGSCTATLKCIIVTMRSPEDYIIMQRVVQGIWDHDQEMTRIEQEERKRQDDIAVEKQRIRYIEELERSKKEQEIIMQNIREREEKEREERRIEEEKEKERMKKVNIAQQLDEQIRKMGRV